MVSDSDSEGEGSDKDETWNNQGEDEWDSPLSSVKDNMSNVGVVVPQAVREKIWAGGYLDLMHFIPKGEKEKKEDKSLRIVGDRVIQKDAERRIHNIFEWTTAFMKYMKIYLMKHKNSIFDMIDYAEDIRFAATKWGGYGWRTYDEQFCVIMASSPTTKWNEINQRLWLLHITPSTMTPSTSGTVSNKSPTPFQVEGRTPGPQEQKGRPKEQGIVKYVLLSTKVDAQGETTVDMNTNVIAASRATIDIIIQKIKNENREQGRCPQPCREKNARQQGAARTAHWPPCWLPTWRGAPCVKTTGRAGTVHRTVGAHRRHPVE